MAAALLLASVRQSASELQSASVRQSALVLRLVLVSELLPSEVGRLPLASERFPVVELLLASVLRWYWSRLTLLQRGHECEDRWLSISDTGGPTEGRWCSAERRWCSSS